MLPPATPAPTQALPPAQDLSTQHDVAIAAGELVALSPRVTRITAPNAGMMTGPGTNSYLLIGRDNVVCVDPGPADDAHLAALLSGVTARSFSMPWMRQRPPYRRTAAKAGEPCFCAPAKLSWRKANRIFP